MNEWCLHFTSCFFISFLKNVVYKHCFYLIVCMCIGTLCSRFMQLSICTVLGNGPNSCFTWYFSHIMWSLVKIIVYKILVIFFLHLCDSCKRRTKCSSFFKHPIIHKSAIFIGPYLQSKTTCVQEEMLQTYEYIKRKSM